MKFFSESGYGPIRGMFSIDHLIFSLTGIIAIFMLVFLTHKKSKEQIDKYIKYILNYQIYILYIILQIIKAMKRRVIMNEYTESFRRVEGNYEIIMKQASELHTDLINIYYK